MQKKQKYLIFINCLIAIVMTAGVANTSYVKAEPLTKGQLEWEAFVSQSAIYTSDNNFLSQSDDKVSTDMWEAGLLLTSNINESLSFATQLLGRKVSHTSGNDIRIDYAFFSYPFYRDETGTLGLRWGRIRSSYGFYNETRDIPHTRTGVVMPQSIYFDMTRNSFYSSDGVELFGFHDMKVKGFEGQRLSAQLFISKPVTDKNEANEVPSLNLQNLRGDKSILAKISYGSEFDGFRGSFTYYRPEYRVAVSFSVDTPTGVKIVSDDRARFYSENMVTSLEYNQLDWSLTVEYLRHKFQTIIQGFKRIGYEETYYVQGVYRLNERWDTYVRYDVSGPHCGKHCTAKNNPRMNFNDINIGTSFRPDKHWLIRFETHYIEGAGRLFKRDNLSDTASYWTASMLQIAYRW